MELFSQTKKKLIELFKSDDFIETVECRDEQNSEFKNRLPLPVSSIVSSPVKMVVLGHS